jgi:hypothetical protein
MSNASIKIAFAAIVFLTAPAASFAMMAGEAGAGNLPISGIPLGPANSGGLNNVLADPSGIENASKMPPLPQQLPPQRITVPAVSQFE